MIDKEITSAVATAVGEAWGMLLAKSVQIDAGDIVELEGFSAELEGACVKADIKFGGDLEGSSSIWMGQVQALTMVGMMMSMGADDALIESTREGSLGDDELDGLKETFNQYCATMATVLRERLDCKVQVELTQIAAEEIGDALEPIGEGAVVLPLSLSLEGYDDGVFYQVLESTVVDSIQNAGSDSNEETMAELGEMDVEGSTVVSPQGQVSLEKIKSLKVTPELILAERNMEMENFLGLAVGSVIEFWKPCDHPAELMLQDKVLASGEVVLCQNHHFGLRVLTLAPDKQIYQKGEL